MLVAFGTPYCIQYWYWANCELLRKQCYCKNENLPISATHTLVIIKHQVPFFIRVYRLIELLISWITREILCISVLFVINVILKHNAHFRINSICIHNFYRIVTKKMNINNKLFFLCSFVMIYLLFAQKKYS